MGDFRKRFEIEKLGTSSNQLLQLNAVIESVI